MTASLGRSSRVPAAAERGVRRQEECVTRRLMIFLLTVRCTVHRTANQIASIVAGRIAEFIRRRAAEGAVCWGSRQDRPR